MKPCTRVGVDVTWKCQLRCGHCFYLRDPNFHKALDVPLAEVKAKIDTGRAGGLDHVVMVGHGEPSLCGNVLTIIDYARSLGMAVSMITNGATGLRRFQEFFAHGLDHLLISSHGLYQTLDDIVCSPGAFQRQAELKRWLQDEGLPFCTNCSLQQRNYKELPALAEYEIGMSVRHFVFLGFIPIYGWDKHVREVAVHPAELRPYIEAGADILLDAGTHFTIRYQPFCHLSPKYWKYVVNARYVFMSPGEWVYTLQCKDVPALWKASVAVGESLGITGDPCSRCYAYRHCGGWNRVYAAAFNGAELTPIREIPDEYANVWGQDGGLHDMNPANWETGTYR